MEQYIMEELLKGKTNEEICSGILEKFSEEDIDFDEITEKILKLNKVKKLQDELKLKEDRQVKERKMNDEVKKLVDEKLNEKLKSISLNKEQKFNTPKSLKRFNKDSKKFEDSMVTSECSGQFNNMIRLISEGDRLNAKAISNEIDQENKYKKRNLYGEKSPVDPLRSDEPAAGGYAIPTEMNQEIMQLEYEQSSMLSHMYSDSIVYQDKVYPLMGGVQVKYIESQKSDISESNPEFFQEKIDMERLGLFSNISNTILRQKGVDLTQAFNSAVASAFASFIDYQIVCGKESIGSKNFPLGVLFDLNTNFIRKSTAGVTVDFLKQLKNSIDTRMNRERTYWICNYQVADAIGLIENSKTGYVFNGYIEGRAIKPFSISLIINNQLPSKFSYNSGINSNSFKDATTGSADVLVCADLSKVIIGLSDIRIDESQHVNFTKDMTTFRALRRYGQKVIMGKDSFNGIAVSAMGITGL